MANPRRIIRKIRPARTRRVDDQVWPLVLAFCVLGGFLAGTVLAYLRLDDNRWYANAWTYLIAIPLVISAALIALALTGNRLLRRTMQLALVLGVIFHIALFILALETDVFHRVWTEVLASVERAPEKEVVKVPQYTKWQHDPQRRAQREFSQPVETEIPDPAVEPTPRESPEEEPADVPLEPQTAPEQPRVVQPNVVRREQVNQSVPRQRDEGSKLSRRAAQMPANPAQAVPLPSLVRRPQRRPEVPQPGPSGTPKVRQPLDMTRPDRPSPPATVSQDRAAQLARQTQSDTPTPASSAATLPRAASRSGITPRADVSVADKPAVAQETRPEVAQPNNTAARKQQSRSVEPQKPEELPVHSLAREALVRRRISRQVAPEQPALATTPRSVPSRQPRITSRPDLTSQVDVPESANASDSSLATSQPAAREVSRQRAVDGETAPTARRSAAPSESPTTRVVPQSSPRAVAESAQPQDTPVTAMLPGRRPSRATALGAVPQRVSPLAREATAENPAAPAPSGVAAARTAVAKSASGNAESQRRLPSVETVGTSPERQTAQQLTARRTADVRPSLNARASADQPPRRALRAALSPSSPTAAENPARQLAATGSQPSTAGPASLVLSKAQTGTAGRGAEANLGVSDPSPDSPATVASGSAQRATTQNVPAGPALSPHAPALVRDGRAGQRQPSAVLQATPLTPATLPGSRRPAAANASASAALTQAASDADRGQLTASKGDLEVDLGPTTRVAQTGVSRASGGGQPQRSPGVEIEAMARTSQAIRPNASLVADAVNPLAVAPASDGGGAAESVELAANANAALEARAGAEDAVIGGPAATAGGAISAPTSALESTRRRAAIAADGPQLSDSTEPVPFSGRKASRSRQLDGDTSVADLSAGNAEDRNDREVPATMFADNAKAASVGKLQAGAMADRTGEAAPDENSTPGAAGSGEPALAARVEAVEAPVGPAAAGGGTSSPLRSAIGPQLATDATAATLEVAGAPESGGHEDAYPQSTQGTLITRLAGGVDAARNGERVGAMSPDEARDVATSGAKGSGTARRSAAAVEGPAVGAETAESPLAKRTATKGLSASAAAQLPGSGLPKDLATEYDEDSEPGPIADWPAVGPTSRLAGAAMPVTIDAPVGVGGLDRQVTVEVGIPDRRSAETSEQVQLKPARFARQEVGGVPDLNATVTVAAEPFRRRARRGDGKGDPAVGAGPETEEAIELGLVYLSRMQTPDGRWTLDGNADQDSLPQLASDTAATGLALLAFQGAGYNHREHRYATVVRGGVDFLVGSQKPDGNLYVEMDSESNRVVALYSHSIAALALCEAYGMTQDPALREPAQKALDFIVETQHPTRGGWRYSPRVGSDTSVTGWMMMALKSGDLASLDVPDDTYLRIRQWLDRAQLSPSQAHLYCYNPYAPDTPEQRGGRQPTYTMTSVGLLMRLYSGWRRDNANMIRGAEYLLEAPPGIGTANNPRRDTYYWYYATQVMFHMGGQYWQAWNQRLHPLLVRSQLREGELAGSWDPRSPVPDRWASFAGRLYVTTMNLLSLEVTYRYLPLYEDTGK